MISVSAPLSPPARQQGFTLIELLVGLALLGFAAALLLQALVTTGIVVQRERTQLSALDQVIDVQHVLRTSIERLRPVQRVDSAGGEIDFRGTRDNLTYVGPPPDRAAPDALHRFQLARSPKGELLLYSVHILRQNVDRTGIDLAGWTPTTLLRGVDSLSIDYFGKGLIDDRRGWQDRWWDRTTLPELIRIRIGFRGRDSRLWPDLLIRPRTVSRPPCIKDPMTGQCKVGS
ncbi:MAG TPA: prepilin-type N-terminal cleavage/methylation domain-containing protein [Sphingobium sp.]|uniref:prepilin-type N-terminal cleavage/methylation domain-containing protein n=1 Tax=Sphingobium sp. TaxID=1912891 RepID=UPI002ED4B377